MSGLDVDFGHDVFLYRVATMITAGRAAATVIRMRIP